MELAGSGPINSCCSGVHSLDLKFIFVRVYLIMLQIRCLVDGVRGKYMHSQEVILIATTTGDLVFRMPFDVFDLSLLTIRN